REDVQNARRLPLDVVEDCPALKVVVDAIECLVPNRLEEGMSGRDPFEGRVFLEVFLVENDAPVFPAEFAEPVLQRVPPLNQRAGNLPDSIDVTILAYFLGVNAGFRGGNAEEILDGFGYETAFPGLDALADDRRQVKFLLCKPLQGGLRDLPKPGRVDFADDPVGDRVLVGAPGVEVAEEL